MEIKKNDVVILLDDPWDNIVIYRVLNETSKEFTLVPVCDLFSHENIRKITICEQYKLLIFPFSTFSSHKYKKIIDYISRIGDLVCALLDKHGVLSLEKLSGLIIKYKVKYKINDDDIEWILRCLIACKVIIATCKKKTVEFKASPSYKVREKQRKFSATIATELASLSERVRFIIDHAPTVGTYRENLLQNSLRKHLPERYHVATGFIFGVSKQIDILIYDRVDYAPLFREGDLVIVPQESVRAIIEVKTRLTPSNIVSALELIHAVSYLDDNQPPFFKGIFAFESSMKNETLYDKIFNFYTDWDSHAQGGRGETIIMPFQHLTCACVINKAFAYTRYVWNENKRLVPKLFSKNSATNLESQTSFFIQSLLSHLKFGGMKPFKIDYMSRMLGEDTFSNEVKDLRAGDDSWGAYFRFDEDDIEENEVEEMEKLILSAQQWLDSEENFDA
ncbi:DUF6602 domain-containing protein [Vreelandella boliviensis]|uniref:DUF6602 domain-containing protein n=1 Tax=Vreelandella boliviensis TaxID=223527 RepID=UPI001B8C2E75|nr:DUF6602 domain-containing protein [Halomonas boliviensis]MBS3668117.1 hypothetical protein [Halomonas boliviensis]